MHLGWGGRWCVPEALEPLAAFVKIDMEVVEQVMARLPDAVSRRSRDLGLGESTPPEMVLRAMAGANRHLADLHGQCRSQAAAARAQGRALEAIASFGAGSPAAAGVSEALGACVASARRGGGAGCVGAVVQSRSGEPWRLAVDGGAGTLGAAVGPGLEPPKDGAGEAMDLPGAVRGGRLAGAVGLLTWLAEHLTAAGGAPDVRSLHATALTGQGWPAAVLLHERDLAEDLGPALPALAACWGQCFTGAAQAEGSRRLAEALSQTTRALTEAQERLAEAQSLARLGELTAGAAHEMNNPLTVISGRSQLLASRLESARDRADAQQVAEAAQRLSDLVTSLHLVARPPEARRGPVNLADLVRGAVRRARERAGPARGAGRGAPPSLRMVVSERVSLISADEGLLSRALEEVVRNAMEAGAREVLELRVEPDPADDRLVFTVRDDGPGMSPHALRHAFDPFFSEKPAGRQTGLGLSIARRLVGLHGGEIALESEPGRGVTCTISLPRWRWTGAAPAQTTKAA
ncbi:MAG: HAMP domain-containing histidine kinase, partial [Phycisphaerae bacterium]|nr:HAMP domain-containing histidine kinase [Phycisphaerae bacterium]